MNDNDQKKVKFFANIKEESDKIIPIKYKEEQILHNNLNFTNEDRIDEILLKKKRNFNNFNKNNINQGKIKSVNYLDYSEFKNPDKLYSLSSNKYSNSSIKNIGCSIIKQTPEKKGNIEFSENRKRNSNYKFSSGKKIITTIENSRGVKDFDDKFGIIENYYLEKTSEKDIEGNQVQNIRCNFNIIQEKSKTIDDFENEETQIYENTKRNLNINDYPNNNIDFSYPFLKNNNIIQSEIFPEKNENIELSENRNINFIKQTEKPPGIKGDIELNENTNINFIKHTEKPSGIKGKIELNENTNSNFIKQTEKSPGIKGNIELDENRKINYIIHSETPSGKKENIELNENTNSNFIKQTEKPSGKKGNIELDENRKINYIIHSETPSGKKGNIELDENRKKNSYYKFSTGKKTIMTIENPRGIKDFDNMVGVIENYYLEKTSEKELEGHRAQNIRCNFKLIQEKSEGIEYENEESHIYVNTKRNLNINDYPNKTINFSVPFLENNNIIQSDTQIPLMNLKKKIRVKEESFSSTNKKRRESKRQAKIYLEHIKEEANSQISESSFNEFNEDISKNNNLNLNENEEKKDLTIKSQEQDINKDISKINNKRNTKIEEEILREENASIISKPAEMIFIDKYQQISDLENKATNEKDKIFKNKDENEFDFQMEIPKENEFNIQGNSNFPDELSEDIDFIRLKNNTSFKSLNDEKIFKDNNINRKYFNDEDNINNKNEPELIDLISEKHNSGVKENIVNNHFKSEVSEENKKEKLENKILGLKSNSFRYDQEEMNNYDFEIIESNDNLLNKSFMEEDNVESKNNEDRINQVNNNGEILNVSELKNEVIDQSLVENNNSSGIYLVGSSNVNKALKNKINDKFPVTSDNEQNLAVTNDEKINKFKLKFEINNFHETNDENDNQEKSQFSNYEMEPVLLAAGNNNILKDKNKIDLNRNNKLFQKFEESEQTNVQKQQDYNLDIEQEKKLHKGKNSHRSSRDNFFEKNENFTIEKEDFNDKNPQHEYSTYNKNYNLPIQNDFIINEKSNKQNLIEYPQFNNNDHFINNPILDNNDNLIEYPILDNQNNFIEYPYFEDYGQQNYDKNFNYEQTPEESEQIDKSKYAFKSHFSFFKNQTNKNSANINETNYNNYKNNNVPNDVFDVENKNRILNNSKKFNRGLYNEPFNNGNLYVNNFTNRESYYAEFDNDNFNYYNNKNFFDDNENGINPLEKFSQFLKINSKNLINGKKRKRRNWRIFSNNKLHFIQSRNFNWQNAKRTKEFSYLNQYEAENEKNEIENEKMIIKELEETLLFAVINRVLKHNNLDENFIKDIDVFKNFYQNQLNLSEIKKLLVEENFVSQEKLDNFFSKINFGNHLINSEENNLDMNKSIIIVVFIFSFVIALRLLGFKLKNFAELILRIPFTKIFLIFSITFLIAFCTYALIKISSEIEKQNSKHIIIARKAQEIISIYLNKLKDYEFCKYYLENKFFMEMLSSKLNISKKYFASKILPLIQKDNPEYRFIKFTDSKGKENAFWRLKDQ